MRSLVVLNFATLLKSRVSQGAEGTTDPSPQPATIGYPGTQPGFGAWLSAIGQFFVLCANNNLLRFIMQSLNKNGHVPSVIRLQYRII